MRCTRPAALLLFARILALSSVAGAQQRRLQIVSSEGDPIAYAWVTVDGGTAQIADEHGDVNLGSGKRQILTLSVRRIGYTPWYGKLELPDTAVVLKVVLPHVAQALGEVRVSGQAVAPSSGLNGFYDRWLMRQKGLLSATFIGPEELEFRHPSKATDMLYGLNGVMLKRAKDGSQVAFGYNGMCQMAIVIDGTTLCPASGCKSQSSMPSISARGGGGGALDDGNAVLIDHYLNATEVTAIEVYQRGGNMPLSLQVADPGCGVIAFWTGSRKP